MDAYIALGSNIGDSIQQIIQALDLITVLPDTQLTQTAGFYDSTPIGYIDQPNFVNTVTQVETRLDPVSLFSALLSIETTLGRQRSFPNAPRLIDLDLILYGACIVSTDTLQVPHPRMQERAFVLLPLLEIAPNIVIPGQGSASALWPLVKNQKLSLLGHYY